MYTEFPLQLNRFGESSLVDRSRYIRGLLEQILFTNPGERLNRPTFGTGLSQLIFAPGSTELAATTRVMVHGALQKWLGNLVQLEQVEVVSRENMLSIKIAYRLVETRERLVETFRRDIQQ